MLSFTEHSLIQCHQQFANIHHILKYMFYHKVSTYSKHVWCQKYTFRKYDLWMSNYRATNKSNCFFGRAGNFVVCTEFHQKWKWNVGKPHFPRTYTPGGNMTNLSMILIISLRFPELLIIGKNVKIRFKTRGSPCYFLSSRSQKIINITKIEHTRLLHYWFHFPRRFSTKNWFTQ